MNLLWDSMGFQSFEMENKSATADGNSWTDGVGMVHMAPLG